MRQSSWRTLTIPAAALLFGACTNGGKTLRDTTGMTPRTARAEQKRRLTDRGCGVRGGRVAARRECLADLARDWNPGRDPDVDADLKEAVRELVPGVQRAS